MIKQYNAIGLQCRQFCDVQQNLRHLSNCIDMAFTLASQELPVKLVCLPESAIQGFPMGDPPVTTIPGLETDFFAAKAKALNTYIIGQLLFVKLKGIPDDRLFNCLFIVNDKGEMIYWRAKTQLERIEAQWTTVPHDVWDLWVKEYGDDLNAFYPVVDTEIGKLGCAVCMERGYPEVTRGLAVNGAEVIYMSTYHEPYVGNGMYECVVRTRAFENTTYVISPNSGAYKFPNFDAPFDICGGINLIADYKGNVIGRHQTTDDSFVGATIDIEALRQYRENNLGIGNFVKDLRTEQFRMIYDNPIYPKNTRSKGKMPSAPKLYEKEGEILQNNIDELKRRGIYKSSAFYEPAKK
jgi:predicted amidohydrolase